MAAPCQLAAVRRQHWHVIIETHREQGQIGPRRPSKQKADNIRVCPALQEQEEEQCLWY